MVFCELIMIGVLNQAVGGDGLGEIEVACWGVDEGVGGDLICCGVDQDLQE